MAMLREAQGQFQEAARHYSKLLEMIEKDPTGTDHETVQYVTENGTTPWRRVAHSRARAPLLPPAPVN